jgi:hypothetical protein
LEVELCIVRCLFKKVFSDQEHQDSEENVICSQRQESCCHHGSGTSSSVQMATVTAEMCEIAFGESNIIKN